MYVCMYVCMRFVHKVIEFVLETVYWCASYYALKWFIPFTNNFVLKMILPKLIVWRLRVEIII